MQKIIFVLFIFSGLCAQCDNYNEFQCQNDNNFSPFWNKDKILIMEKN